MHHQLFASGNARIINNASDVASMDASTQPSVYKMFSQLFIEWIQENKIQSGKYFAAGDEEVDIVDERGAFLKKVKISGLAKTMLYITNTKNNGKNFKLKDGYFAPMLEIANTFFASGQFNTTGQHTTLLSIIGKLMARDFKALYPGIPVDLDSKAFGDDSMRRMLFNRPVEEENTYVQELVRLEKKYLRAFGFKTEIFISRMYTDFLQQAAVCGIQVPKSARVSLYCDERGETKSRDPIAVVKVMRNVFLNASQRFNSIENIISLLNGVWMCIKTVYLRAGDMDTFRQSYWQELVYQYLDRVILVIPWITFYLPPINQPNPTLETNDGSRLLITRAYTSIMGDVGWIWLLNGCLTNEDWAMLFDVGSSQSDLKETGLTLLGADYVQRPLNQFIKTKLYIEFKMFLAIHFLDYSRAATLSKHRKEAVQDTINLLGLKSDSYRSKNHVEISKMSAQILKNEFGITVPKRITYYGQSETRIEQAITALDETSNELPLLDEDIVDYLLRVNPALSKENQNKVDKYAIRYNFNPYKEFQFPPSVNFTFELPTVPGYRLDSDFGKLLLYTGTSLTTGGLLTKASQFSSSTKTNQKFDYEAAVEFALKARAKGREAENLYRQVLHLSPAEQKELDNAINNLGTIATSYEYSSQFNPNSYFMISGLTNLFSNNWSSYADKYPRIRNLFTMITRDIYFMVAHICEGLSLKLRPSAFTIKYYIMTLKTRLHNTTVLTKVL